MTETTPYQLALVAGEAHERASSLASSVADITPDPDDVLAGFRRAGLTAADMRSRVVLCVPRQLPNLVELYATLCGFTGRFVDVDVAGTVIDVGDLYQAAVRTEDLGRPVERVDVVQVGGSRDDMVTLTLADLDPRGGVRPQVVSDIRFARRCRIVGSEDPVMDLIGFAVTSGLRHRNGRDRFPQLVDGTEPADVLDRVGVDLDGARQAGMRHRRVARSYELVTVPPAEPTGRQVDLTGVAHLPVRDLLVALGSVEAAGLFSCPRPQNHTHGDATPSAKVYDDGRFRCHRCDAEPIDTLRLLVHACAVTPDEAALLVRSPEQLAKHRERIVTERNERAGTTVSVDDSIPPVPAAGTSGAADRPAGVKDAAGPVSDTSTTGEVAAVEPAAAGGLGDVFQSSPDAPAGPDGDRSTGNQGGSLAGIFQS